MKKLSIFLMSLLLGCTLLQAQTVTIGTGTGNQNGPISNHYGYERYIDIYTPSDGLIAGYITNLEWDKYTSNLAPIDIPVKIYLKEVSDSSLSSSQLIWDTLITNAVNVFDGIITPSTASGWINISTETHFHYSGTKNLMVMVATNVGGGGDINANLTYRYSNSGNNTHAYCRSDNTIADNAVLYYTVDNQRSNIRISFSPNSTICNAVLNLRAANITSSSADLEWNISGQETQWLVSYKADTGSIWTDVTITDTIYSLSSLQPNTNYTAAVRSYCGIGDTSAARTVRFYIPQPSVSIPFTETFESTTDWVLINETETNKWHIGTAANNTENGTYGLYISDSNGVFNTYSNSSESYVYATKLLQFDNVGDYFIEYDWKASGDQYSDYMQVWLVPENTIITAGNAPNTMNWINLYGSTNLNLQTAWLHKQVLFSIIQSGNYKLVFYWKNDWSFGDNPPAAVDNISITAAPCSKPTGITVDGITSTNANVCFHALTNAQSIWIYYKPLTAVSWDSINVAVPNYLSDTSQILANLQSGTDYLYYLKTDCSLEYSPVTDMDTFRTLCEVISSLPWFENFDSVRIPNLPNCWEKIINNSHASISTSSSNSLSPPNSINLHNSSSILSQATILLSHPISPNINVANLRTRFFAKSNSQNVNLQIGILTNPYDTSTFIPTDTIALVSSDWNTIISSKFSTLIQPATEWCIAYKHGNAEAFQQIYIDDIYIETPPLCPDVINLSYTRLAPDSIYIQYTSTATNFNINYRIEGTSTWATTTSTDTLCGIGGLQPNTQYEIKVQSVCGNNLGAWSYSIFCTTSQLPATIPFTEDFETTSDWVLVNGTETNKWYIDTAVNNTVNGTHGLYISHTNGISNIYYHSSSSVYAVKLLQFNNTGDYSIEYDWKAKGDGTRDYMQVWLAPENATITAGSPPDTTNWINLYGSQNLETQSTWQHSQILFSISQSGNYNLVFYWRNDNRGGFQPPAAIDNISIKASSCLRPQNLGALNITSNSTDLTWSSPASNFILKYKKDSDTLWTTINNITTTGFSLINLIPNTSYQVCLNAVCSTEDTSFSITYAFITACENITIPLLEGFETINTTTDLAVPDCWSYLKVDQTAVFMNTSTTYAHTGTMSYRIAGIISPPNSKVMLISPLLPKNINVLKLKFWMGYASSTDCKIGVGYMSNPMDVSTFTVVDTFDVPESWTEFTVNFDTITDTGSYIAFSVIKLGSAQGGNIYIDDINIESTILPCQPVDSITTVANGTSVKVDWTTPVGQTQWKVRCLHAGTSIFSQIVDTTSYTFNGLERGNTYTFEVFNICGTNDTSFSISSEPVTINTCVNVTDIIIEKICPTNAIVNWLAVPEQAKWQLSYKPQAGGTVITKEVTTKKDTLVNLTSNTTYELQIRPICGIGDTGEYTTSVTILTNSCDTVENIVVPRTDNNDSIFVSWYINECHQNWQISVVPQGNPVDSENTITTNTYQGTYIKLSNPSVNYDVYVRGSCGNDIYGSWSKASSIVNSIKSAFTPSIKIALAPNPARKNTKLNINGIAGNVEMVFMTVDGKVISKENIFCTSELKKDISLKGLAKGTYLIRLTHKDWTKVERLIVQ